MRKGRGWKLTPAVGLLVGWWVGLPLRGPGWVRVQTEVFMGCHGRLLDLLDGWKGGAVKTLDYLWEAVSITFLSNTFLLQIQVVCEVRADTDTSVKM